jgi:hypothetical protein
MSKTRETHLPASISDLKNFPGVIPGPPLKRRGRKDGQKGKKGIRDTAGEEGSGVG